MLVRLWEKGIPHSLLEGVQTGTATMRTSVVVSQKGLTVPFHLVINKRGAVISLIPQRVCRRLGYQLQGGRNNTQESNSTKPSRT